MRGEYQNLRKICYHCIGEEYLKINIVKNLGKRRKCFYCGKNAISYDINELSPFIEGAFSRHYDRTPINPNEVDAALLSGGFLDGWCREGWPVTDIIRDIAGIPEGAARDIQEILEEKYSDFEAAKLGEEMDFSKDSYYEERMPDSAIWHENWQEFKNSLISEARLFNRVAMKHLASIFEDIDSMIAWDGAALIIKAGPGTPLTELYRARVFQSKEELKEALKRPDKSIGTPPSSKAATGRMNAHGISVFYGAETSEVAIAEVRPPVGSDVAVGCFDIIKTVQLLDLTALKDVKTEGSIFDPDYANRLAKVAFLRFLSETITKPIMPNDEALEYLPTQAIADFLATGISIQVDGIRFPSVQTNGNGQNVVLFHKSARVEALEMMENAEVDVLFQEMGYEDEDSEAFYSVTNIISSTNKFPQKEKKEYTGILNFIDETDLYKEIDSDYREPTLRIKKESMFIYSINSIIFQTDKHDIKYFHLDDDDCDF